MGSEIREMINKIKSLNESTNRSFKSIPIDKNLAKILIDWKQIEINGKTFDFMYPNFFGENVFTISLDGVGEIGKATVNLDELYLDNIRIDPDYRRLGLATKLYEYIEGILGKKLKPSPIKQSAEIKKFWDKRNIGKI